MRPSHRTITPVAWPRFPSRISMLMEYSPFFTFIIWSCPGLWPLLPPPLLFYDLLKVSNQGLRAADLIFHFVQCGFWSCANPHFLIEQPLKLILLGFQRADDVYSRGRHLFSSRALRKISNRDSSSTTSTMRERPMAKKHSGF